MEVKASTKYVKMSPRKVRAVVDVLRGQTVLGALDQLQFISKWAAVPVKKLIDSAVANAEHNFELKQDNLYIKEIKVNEGPTLKRWMPRARGRATTIRKRSSHLELVLAELKASGKTGPKKREIEAPIKLGEKAKEDKGVKLESKDSEKNKVKKEGKVDVGKEAIDPRGHGKGKNTRIEGKSNKGFGSKFFRRKSG
jgi:large subunit ribosomal protein L22